MKKYFQQRFLRIYLTGQFKISRESYFSRYRVFMIGNYIAGVFFTINTILLKKYCQKSFLRIYHTCQFKINKKFSFFAYITVSPVSYQFINTIFRGSRISNRITVLSQSKYNAKNSFGNKGSRAYHTCLFKAIKKFYSSCSQDYLLHYVFVLI